VRETVVLVVALLVKAFTAELTDERLDTLVYPHVSVECRRPVKGLATRATDVRLFRSVNDLVATQGRRLTKTFVANLHQSQNYFS